MKAYTFIDKEGYVTTIYADSYVDAVNEYLEMTKGEEDC